MTHADFMPDQVTRLKRELLNVLANLDRNALSSRPESTDRESWGQQIVVGLDARIHGLFRSITYLLEKDHAEEAAILIRTLLSDALALTYFFLKTDELEEMAVRFVSQSVKEERGLIEFQLNERGSVPGRGIAGNDEDLLHVQEQARDIGMTGKIRNLPDERGMLREIGQDSWYAYFKWASGHVHTGRVVLDSRAVPQPDGGLQIGITTVDYKTWTTVAMLAVELFTVGHVAACVLRSSTRRNRSRRSACTNTSGFDASSRSTGWRLSMMTSKWHERTHSDSSIEGRATHRSRVA